MRCVCKAWNSSLQSFKSEEIWFVMARPPKYGPRNWRVRSKYGHLEWRFRAYSTCSLHKTEEETSELEQKAFFRPPLPNPVHSTLSALLGGRNCYHVAHRLKYMDIDAPFFHDLFLCSAGGLISAIVRRPDAVESYDFIVFNCLTGSVKVLPPPSLSMQGPNTFYLSMTRNGKDPSCYYILLNTRFLFPTSFEFFESRSACWKEVNNPHLYFKSGKSLRNFVSSHPSSDQLSVVDADFWWLVSSMDNREHCLLAYHVSLDAWTSLLVPLIPCEIVLAQIKSIVKFEGRLLRGVPCVGPDHVILGFGVWELQLATSTWVEVARTPQHLTGPPSIRDDSWRCSLFADGGIFWMTLCNPFTYRSFRPPLVFDMARNTWYSLPLERTSRKFGCIFVYRPSFSAFV
ncbi:hypothetical protein GOP47_0025231 [Adiantum capillus-veneris]|uniref:F-box domain-containing protein n=1 Tax=Adiantum capillus-veneris TaxID=13818 RepID=A0A9D4U5V2_ADICA|nr:hypothetical protein GOP47_0025231 [Adiantum capillus-veneris]